MSEERRAEGLDPEVLEFAHGLFALAREGAAEKLGEFLDAGLSPDLTDDTGATLLVVAAESTCPGVVRVLLDHGADHGRVDDRGRTALAAAASAQDQWSVRLLLAAGADPRAGSPSALEAARSSGSPEVLALLEGPGTGG